MIVQIPFKSDIFLLFYLYQSHLFPYFKGSLVENESREQLDDVPIGDREGLSYFHTLSHFFGK